jgi:hypothetical protein
VPQPALQFLAWVNIEIVGGEQQMLMKAAVDGAKLISDKEVDAVMDFRFKMLNQRANEAFSK